MNGSDRLRKRAEILREPYPVHGYHVDEVRRPFAEVCNLAADLGDALREAANYIRTEPYVSAWEQAGMQNKVDAFLARLDAWGTEP